MADDLLVVLGGLVLTPTFEARHQDIVVRGGVIVDVVAPGTGPAEARRIDAGDRAVMPGLVNGHVHGHGTLAKGLVEDRWPLEYFLNALPWLGAGRTVEDKYLNGLLGAVEMIRKGCTAAFDLFFEFPMPTRDGIFAVGRAYRDAGVRAVLAPMVADQTFYEAYPELVADLSPALRDEALSLHMAPFTASADAAGAIFAAWPFDRDLIRPGLAPSIPLHCSDAFLERCRALAQEHDLVLQTHLAETKVQAVTGVQRYGRTLTAHLEALGLLGPRFSAAHAIWLDDDDMRRMADSGSSVVHAPGSNLRFGSGMAQIRRMLDLGINVGLATDGANTSDSLNMFEAMRTGTSISTMLTPDNRRWLGTDEILGMATLGSARAMGFEGKIGRIAPGYKADLVLLDLAHINYVPLGHLARQIVFTENGAAVDSVMIDGKLVLDHGRITLIDEAKLRRDAGAAAERLQAASADLRAMSHRLQPAIGQFCRSFACRSYHVGRLACDPIPGPA